MTTPTWDIFDSLNRTTPLVLTDSNLRDGGVFRYDSKCWAVTQYTRACVRVQS